MTTQASELFLKPQSDSAPLDPLQTSAIVSEFIQTIMSQTRRDVLEVLEEAQGCSRSMLSPLERKACRRGNGRKGSQEGATGQEKGTAGPLSSAPESVRKHTMVLQLLPAPPHWRSKAVKICFTQSARTHYPIEPLHNSPSYKLFSCEGNCSVQCAKNWIRRKRSSGSSHC